MNGEGHALYLKYLRCFMCFPQRLRESPLLKYSVLLHIYVTVRKAIITFISLTHFRIYVHCLRLRVCMGGGGRMVYGLSECLRISFNVLAFCICSSSKDTTLAMLMLIQHTALASFSKCFWMVKFSLKLCSALTCRP